MPSNIIVPGKKKCGVKKGNIPWNRGLKKVQKHTEETKRKISEALRKRIRLPEIGRKISLAKMGHTVSQETRDKISKSKKGNSKPNSGSFKKGSIPWNRGTGLSITNSISCCFQYRQWRDDVHTRYDFTCQKCGKRGGKLHAHHSKKSFKHIMAISNIDTLDGAL